jgi:hypothetical protein
MIGRDKIREPSVSNTLLSSTRSTVSDSDTNELINTSQKRGAVKRHILSDIDANELINTSQKGELLVSDLIGVTRKVISLPYNLSSVFHGFLTVDVEQKISVEFSQKLASWGLDRVTDVRISSYLCGLCLMSTQDMLLGALL